MMNKPISLVAATDVKGEIRLVVLCDNGEVYIRKVYGKKPAESWVQLESVPGTVAACNEATEAMMNDPEADDLARKMEAELGVDIHYSCPDRPTSDPYVVPGGPELQRKSDGLRKRIEQGRHTMQHARNLPDNWKGEPGGPVNDE